MKKVYSAALGLLITGTGVMAQLQTHPYQKDRSTLAQSRTPNVVGDRGSSIWCDDFSDPTNWEVGTLNGLLDNWTIGTTGPTGLFAIDNILSTTASNGFALYDSDLYCTAGDDAYIQMANPVDLQGVPFVVLTFEQYYRQYLGTCFVDVSNDGATWTSFEVNSLLGVNMSTTNPSLVSVNISSVAGDQGSVWVRFRYTGACDYAWMVDDVCISEQLAFDGEMIDGYLTHTGTGEEYGMIPPSQFTENMVVGARFTNNGYNALTNVTATIEVRNEADVVVGTATTTLPSMATGDTVTFEDVLPTLAFEPIGLYSVSFTMSADEIDQDGSPDNNTYERAFDVSDVRYALDGVNVHPAGTEMIFALGTSSFTGSEDGMNCMTYYDITEAIDVYGIEVLLAQSEVGGFAYANILDTVDVYAATTVVTNPLVETDSYDLQQGDINAGVVRLLFPSVYNLQPGAYYANVVLNSNAGAGHIRILDDQTVIQPGAASMVYYNNDLSGNGEALAVRLITEPLQISVGENNTLEGVSMFPNPTTGLVNIRTSENEVFNVDVMNVTGELVRTARISGTSTMDLTELAKGVYTVRIYNERGTMTERVTLQ